VSQIINTHRTYRLPNTDGTARWVWVGSFRAATATGSYDMRLDFTSHTGSANPNSEQDTIMILTIQNIKWGWCFW
jgi:hypothetical protein